jgi:hypothetical protein
LVAIAADETFYVLRFNRAAYQEAAAAGTVDPNEGVEGAFEIVAEVSDKYHLRRLLLTTVYGQLNGWEMYAFTRPRTDCSILSESRLM